MQNKWIHIEGSKYKCPKCGTRFFINMKKPWKCCPVCEQRMYETNLDYIKSLTAEELTDWLLGEYNEKETSI